MIKIGILGEIGSGKSYVAKNFGYPVFNADKEVAQLYKKNKNVVGKDIKIEKNSKFCDYEIINNGSKKNSCSMVKKYLIKLK